MFKRVLIANRGEIAVRIARAAEALRIETLAVFPEADAQSLHTRAATSAVKIGKPGEAIGAYLDIDSLIAAAKAHGCDAVHPGYGFLSENAAFAARCAAEGIVFVGPPPAALGVFGDKTAARDLAETLGVPVIKGSRAADAAAAAKAAETIGYPVMLKAAAGGGGRGMRIVEAAAEMAEAFARCQSEAQSSFGDGTIFLEKLIQRPRHIEVQVLGDAAGAVVHLHERDCSVQLRHQKVIEIAPAPNLADDLRARLAGWAVQLAGAAGIVNAATIEFLVTPETGEAWFIEGNPRIQVEHTVTEEVTGVDLVETQFRIAAGATLVELGLANPPPARGFAVQTRIVAQGPGVFTAYREPGGPGVRVDSVAYPGYAPHGAFDPMFAKLICRSGSDGSLVSALDRARRALGEFHIVGVRTGAVQLAAMLAHPALRAGDARTDFLIANAHLLTPPTQPTVSRTQALLDQSSQRLTQSGFIDAPDVSGPSLVPPTGCEGVAAPMTGLVVECTAKPGDKVIAGQSLAVVSAMKMEAAVNAPCAGEIVEILPLVAGDALSAGQVIAAIRPSGETGPAPVHGQDTWAPILEEVAALQGIAHARFAPGTTDPGVIRQRNRNKLTCRERIDRLLDAGSFREIGSLAGFTSYADDGSIAAFTPANHVGGTGKVEGRLTVVCADDFTSRGGHSDGAIGSKSRYLDRLSLELRCPSVRLLDGSSGGGSVASMVPQQKASGESTAAESSGAIAAGKPRVTGGGGSFLPGDLGSEMFAQQLAEVPVVNVLLGSVVGLGAAKAVLGHFSVMVRDIAQLFVAGPPVVAHAMGYEVTKEDLGDWRIHCRNGSVDNLAETEDDALTQTQRFLSYLPGSVYEIPPRLAPDPNDPPDRREEELFTIVPRKRTATFDARRMINLMVDRGSFFEIGALWGTDQIVGLARFNGYPVGIITSDSRHANGGALTAQGCDKLIRHHDLCDVFHLPLINLCDNPGFAVGIEHEIAGTIRKGGEWMIAFSQMRTPVFTVITRRSFGVAGNNYATPFGHPSARVVWPAADVGGIPPEGGIEAAYKRQLAEAADPVALRAEINARIESARGPIGPLNRFQIEEMIDPRDTRPLICEWLENAYRLISLPDRLGPRPIAFRP